MKKKEAEKQIDMDTEDVWSMTDSSIPSDVTGSYTGIPLTQLYDQDDMPIQDADDL